MKIYKTPAFVQKMTAEEYKIWIETGQLPSWLKAEPKGDV